MNALIIKEELKRLPFKIKKEIYGNLVLYKIYDLKNHTAKKLIKKLAKDRIVNIGFDNNIPREFISHFKGKVNIVFKRDELLFNIDKMALKLSNSLGLEDGEITIGVFSKDKTELILKKLISLKRKLKSVVIFKSSDENYDKAIDCFYKATGIPVIQKEDFLIPVSFLIKAGETGALFKYPVIDLTKDAEKGSIVDVKIKMWDYKNIFNISDAVYAKLILNPFEIESFLRKKTWH